MFRLKSRSVSQSRSRRRLSCRPALRVRPGDGRQCLERDDKLAKFWLAPVREAYNYGFSPRELNRIAAITQENEPALLKAWHEYFNRDDGTGDGQKGQSD
jgi:hypothetical protein